MTLRVASEEQSVANASRHDVDTELYSQLHGDSQYQMVQLVYAARSLKLVAERRLGQADEVIFPKYGAI